MGGPIVKKKAFFFFDYEHDQFDQPFTVGAIVPTALERTGDFSQSVQPGRQRGRQFMIRLGPSWTEIVPSSWARKRVPTANVIPGNRLNPLSLALINLFPCRTARSTRAAATAILSRTM